jgi:hypothetical protein
MKVNHRFSEERKSSQDKTRSRERVGPQCVLVADWAS